jgi:hypothetical protein
MSVVAVAATCLQLAASGPAAQAQTMGANPGAAAASTLKAADSTCMQVASQPWPVTETLRRGEVQRLERLLPACIDNPMFLATLGGLLLEQGDAEQALIWLERSLLIDPDNLGAQADHAFTLAALGEPKALEQLTRTWQARTDLPPLLRERLFPKTHVAQSPVRLGRSGLPVWGLQREISVLAGYESNLDQSPRLTELTLTAPEGNVVLPVDSRPRRGAAISTSAALHGAYSPEPGTVWRTGLSASARNTPSERATDWTYVQWSASGVQRWAWMRTHLDLSASWVGGPLNEPYRLYKAGFAADVGAGTCRLRAGIDTERRRQASTVSFNATSTGIQVSTQCPLAAVPGASLSLFARTAMDRPETDARPGGLQRHGALGGRLTLPLNGRWQMDLTARASNVQDELGYSELLGDNIPRRIQQRQISVEWIRRPDAAFLAGAQAVVQLHAVRQSSNLRLFEYQALSLHGGLRWEW